MFLPLAFMDYAMLAAFHMQQLYSSDANQSMEPLYNYLLISRFQHNSKTEKECRKEGCLTTSEINEAEKRIIRMIQEESFTEESVRGLKTLNVFKDEEGILRIKTKLTKKDDLRNFRYPILLPGKHRNIQIQRIGLPQDRVEESAAFEVSGVDLDGPLTLKEGEKCSIVLFTCAAYRAIHLELTLSLDTRSFLLCLRRFIARRGRPKFIYSDKGTNFVGAENLQRKLDWDVIEREASIQRITWKFIPPFAPWWGGFWERLVQMVNKLLRRVLGNA
ncbi:uncharacterized protein LOC129962317 [Argiope bruennichi]|uniref:uncharacterized protein LOC129962317 n=1 Tax=Argiope bruennichi TaxID=94029 RepID=UPI002493D955|nr:uncharacterized protein LOC129962317 [Argiope bruennichi]